MKTQSELHSAIAQSLGTLATMREFVFAEAEILCQEFWRVRADLQQEYIRNAPRHIGLHRRLHDAYAPLKLAWRDHKGSLDLYWMTISHGRRGDRQTGRNGTIKKRLSRGNKKKDGSYSDRKLKQYARPWELQWIRDTELKASHLRHIYLSIHPALVALRRVDERLVSYRKVIGDPAHQLSPAHNGLLETRDQLDPALSHPMVAPLPKR